MTKRYLTLCHFALIIFLASRTAAAAEPVVYTLSWLGIPIVDVTITMEMGDTLIHGLYRASTRPLFDKVYAVDNLYEIWVRSESHRPVRFSKTILEKGRQKTFWAQYQSDPQKIIYANGLERKWSDDNHTLFSALLWVQHHPWKEGEDRDILVEVEGVTWLVNVHCVEVERARVNGGLGQAEIDVLFRNISFGEPVLSTTDILTHMLPGEGHHLKFGLDLDHQEVLWAEYGSRPFLVKAERIGTKLSQGDQ